MLLNILGVTVGYGASTILQDASVQINSGDFLGIVGPNGSGKSTLLRTISRVLKPLHGEVLLEEKDIYSVSATQVAKQMAVMTQENGLSFPFAVRELIMMGRIPHLKRFAREGPEDQLAVDRAMILTDTVRLADRQLNELSGGEKQRVLLARALAQEPKILLLDEPTANLDLTYQLEIMELLVRFRREYGLTIIMVLHDLNLASRYCDYLVVVKQGRIHAIGSPNQVITANIINDVYGCRVRVEKLNLSDRPYIIFDEEEIDATKNLGPQVHVIGGGGSGAVLLRNLVRSGWKVSTGVVNVGDSDWQEAIRLGLNIVEAPPFCSVDGNELTRNQEMMQKADFIVMAGVPFGSGNIGNLEAVMQESARGAKVIVVNKPDISERDYTGGIATELYTRMISGRVQTVNSDWEAIQFLEGEKDNATQR